MTEQQNFDARVRISGCYSSLTETPGTGTFFKSAKHPLMRAPGPKADINGLCYFERLKL